MNDPLNNGEPSVADRLAARLSPDGWPVMYQSWGSLLFMHWRVPVSTIRPLIPQPVQIDTFDGSAWVAVTPFTLWGARPVLTPALPLISHFHETNVRTYVYLDGVPGVWFFSLDANAVLPVIAARALFHLPYRYSEIHLEQTGNEVNYSVIRRGESVRATLDVHWTIGDPLPESQPGSLEFFLTERYCLYTSYGNAIYRARIAHPPWPLQNAELRSFATNLFQANSIDVPDGDPIVLGGGPVDVEVWPLEKVRG